jgi:hypothetical protein
MAVVDATNLTLTVTAPASGRVRLTAWFVTGTSSNTGHIAVGWFTHGTTTLVGQVYNWMPGVTANEVRCVSWLITGLTPGNSYHYDLAWGSSATSATVTLYATAITTTTVSTTSGAPVRLLAEAA